MAKTRLQLVQKELRRIEGIAGSVRYWEQRCKRLEQLAANVAEQLAESRDMLKTRRDELRNSADLKRQLNERIDTIVKQSKVAAKAKKTVQDMLALGVSLDDIPPILRRLADDAGK